MLFVNSFTTAGDNTGVKKVKCLHFYRKGKRGEVGDVGLFVIHKVVPKKKLKLGDKVKAVIVSSTSWTKRPLGFSKLKSYAHKVIFFKKNEMLPLSKRLNTHLYAEVRFRGFFRFTFLAKYII